MDRLFVPHMWELMEEAQTRLENADVGESLHISEPMVPLVFNDGEGYCLFGFTSKDSVPNDYSKQGYVIVDCGIHDVLNMIRAVEKILEQPITILIDPFDYAKRMTQAELESILQ